MRPLLVGPLSVVALALVLLSASALAAQEQPPVIQAHSKVITIIDGQHEKKNFWYIMPDRSPDVYYAELPRVPHQKISPIPQFPSRPRSDFRR